ncbi:MAG TPA: hypothetical protein PKE45_00470 [Caldilineaceae bacterium]|nr:hypothetical protein [Caldilineaceae bacterium]
MRHLLILSLNDSTCAQDVRNALQEAKPAQLTILAEEPLASAGQAAPRIPLSLSLLVRLPLAVVVGGFAGVYYGAKWFAQTMEAVTNFLSQPQAAAKGPALFGRVVLLVDAAEVETVAEQFRQLGANVQQLDLSAPEQG